jgi:hypothetical protein
LSRGSPPWRYSTFYLVPPQLVEAQWPLRILLALSRLSARFVLVEEKCGDTPHPGPSGKDAALLYVYPTRGTPPLRLNG